jgi:hypothetical protein
MALVRCREHEPSQTRTTYVYVKSAKPLNSPSDALVCGVKGCLNGDCSVYLTQEEANAYDRGERVFSTRVSQLSGKEALTGAKVRVC